MNRSLNTIFSTIFNDQVNCEVWIEWLEEVKTMGCIDPITCIDKVISRELRELMEPIVVIDIIVLV